MEPLDLLFVSFGIALILLALLDVFLAVLHLDISGVFAPRIFRIIWKCAVFLARRFSGIRRQILALAGPVMMVLIFLIWIGLFTFGFALIYWRNLSSYRSETELGTLGFIDALYYSGITGTVLGYGDISPISGAMKLCAFIQSGLGFALLTGIVTYLLSVSNGVTLRNSLTLHLAAATKGGTDGVHLLVRCLQSRAQSDLPERFTYLNNSLQKLHEKMHQFPILDLFYRSRDPLRDPEPMLLSMTEICAAGHILSLTPSHSRLRPMAEELGWTITNTMKLFAKQYLGQSLCHKIEEPEPEQIDRDYLEQIRNTLSPHLSESFPPTYQDSTEALFLVCRRRIFFEELDRFTDWQSDHGTFRK
jgi:hypothetical protein